VVRDLPGPVRAVYEAGPTGYGLVRRARAEGIEMAVCSPGNIERRPGDRIKTDKRDAIRLGRGKPAGVVTIAIARELIGACWEIATAHRTRPHQSGASRWRGGPGTPHTRTSTISPASSAPPCGG
jgi:hypothetical protein